MRLSSEDINSLKGIGVHTVIDLRSQQETVHRPCALEGVSGIRYHNISFTDDFTYLADVTYCPLHHLVPVLQGQNRVCEILTAMARAEEGAIIFHCAAGKDRTGIIAALLLMAAHVPAEDIMADYQVTRTYIRRILDEIKGDSERDIDLCRTEPEWIEPLMEYVLSFGSVEDYLLDVVGVSIEVLDAIGKRLTGC